MQNEEKNQEEQIIVQKLSDLIVKGPTNQSKLIVKDARLDAESRLTAYERQMSSMLIKLDEAMAEAAKEAQFSWEKPLMIQLEIDKVERSIVALKKLSERYL